MPWSPVKRQQFLGVLDGIERVLVVGGRLMLGLLIAAVLVGTAIVIIQKPFGAGNQGEWFYFGVAVLLVLGWAIGQFVALGRRKSSFGSPFCVQSNQQDGVQTWALRLGTGTADAGDGFGTTEGSSQFGFSKTFEIPLATLMAEMLPNEETIRRVEAEIDRGVALEEACRLVQPHYDEWNRMQQRAYSVYVSRVLEQRANADCPAEE
jgi:hypothetical protein